MAGMVVVVVEIGYGLVPPLPPSRRVLHKRILQSPGGGMYSWKSSTHEYKSSIGGILQMVPSMNRDLEPHRV